MNAQLYIKIEVERERSLRKPATDACAWRGCHKLVVEKSSESLIVTMENSDEKGRNRH